MAGRLASAITAGPSSCVPAITSLSTLTTRTCEVCSCPSNIPLTSPVPASVPFRNPEALIEPRVAAQAVRLVTSWMTELTHA